MICFKIGRRKFCIPIPILIWRWPWPPPNGDPWKRLGDWVTTAGPTPQPWKVNAPIVATIAELAKHAQGDLKGRLQKVARDEIVALKKELPEGATLELKA